jgi:hypothetical protein
MVITPISINDSTSRSECCEAADRERGKAFAVATGLIMLTEQLPQFEQNTAKLPEDDLRLWLVLPGMLRSESENQRAEYNEALLDKFDEVGLIKKSVLLRPMRRLSTINGPGAIRKQNLFMLSRT